MESFSHLPLPIKAALATASGICAVVVAVVIDSRALPFLLGGVLVVCVALLGYLVFQRVVRRRRAEAMGTTLAQHSATPPRGVSDPARRARLDDLRITFEKGLGRFRAAGKDLYSLPWYLVVGEPGAGKTEAIRNCNVGFPSGLQDKLQGAGGTLNMHWWFTNHAVMIDTAGRLMFEEVPPGTTGEWNEFLQLLRRSRPHCPINGLILVIPADSLIKDSSEEIARKAGRIAEQLNLIQSRLDVRFPVFTFITKCDLIHGFREFFNSLDDPQLQHQMLGWSNPESLDQPFRPELLDEHFESVIQRLRRRRLGLIQDPTPQDSSDGRRLDEVDALFSLPASMAQIAPGLQRYLETIFGQNEWSGQPLFLRGIYFASAMREGSALDRDLAEAIGVPVDALPEGRAWERERAYFLRDLFTEKIFKERGLVTRATNTRRLLWRRQMTLLGAGTAGLLLLLALSWLGAHSLRESIGREREFWLAARDGWVNGLWRPVVAPELRGSSTYVFNGAQVVKVGATEMSLVEYHRQLADLVQTDLKVPLIFRLVTALKASTNESRRRAQRVLLESGVILPLVGAAREKIMHAREPWSPERGEALAFLLRLEGMIQNRAAGLTADELSSSGFLAPLTGFVLGPGRVDPDLALAFDKTYVKGNYNRGLWPPRWLSGGGSLAVNQPLSQGLSRFITELRERQQNQSHGITAIRRLRDELRAFRKLEDDMARLASTTGNEAEFARALEGMLAVVARQKLEVERNLGAAEPFDTESGANRLSAAYRRAVEESRARTDKALGLLRAELDRFPPTGGTAEDQGPASTLATDIRRALIKVQQEHRSTAETHFTAEELAEMKTLDALCFSPSEGEVSFLLRGAAYQELLAHFRDTAAGSDLVLGTLSGRLLRIREEAKAVTAKAQRYQGPFQREFSGLVKRAAEHAEANRTLAWLTRALDEIEGRLERRVSFPLLLGGSGLPMTLAGLRDAGALLRLARADLTAMKSIAPPALLQSRIDGLELRVQRMAAVADALVVDDRRAAEVTVSVGRREDQVARLSAQVGNQRSREWFIGDLWNFVRLEGRVEGTSPDQNSFLARFSTANAGLRFDLFRYPDDTKINRIDRSIAMEGPWSVVTLLHQPSTRRLPGGKDWEVVLTTVDGLGQRRHMVLLLQFEKPVPELDQWPVAARRAAISSALRPQ